MNQDLRVGSRWYSRDDKGRKLVCTITNLSESFVHYSVPVRTPVTNCTGICPIWMWYDSFYPVPVLEEFLEIL